MQKNFPGRGPDTRYVRLQKKLFRIFGFNYRGTEVHRVTPLCTCRFWEHPTGNRHLKIRNRECDKLLSHPQVCLGCGVRIPRPPGGLVDGPGYSRAYLADYSLQHILPRRATLVPSSWRFNLAAMD